ncbi:hypothetical protein BH11ACT8_BH11ACT8_27660 [soil metagenome]
MRLSRRTTDEPGAEAEGGTFEVPAPTHAPGELPTLGVITMARDEGSMLRRWVEHYAAQVGAEHVLVIDDNSSDGSTDDLPCPVIKIPYLRKSGFEPSRMGLVGGVSAGLLQAYDAVLFCDADEFVVADPKRHESLRHFVADRPGRPAVGVLGLNVVHDVSREAALRDDEPILGQRRLAKFLPLMCKPSLKWVPADWAHASHGILCPFEVDPDLFMFHMKFSDRAHLDAAAARRHHLNQTEGRAAGTSWARPADEMVALLDEIATAAAAYGDPADVEAFKPRGERLARIVQRQGPMWRATGQGQVIAMRERPLVRIPDRFLGLV